MSRPPVDLFTLALLVALCLAATGVTLLEPRFMLEAGLVYRGF